MAAVAAKIEYQSPPSTPRSQRRLKRKRKTAILGVVASIVGLVGPFCYIGMYAQVTRCGYNTAALQKQIRQAEAENASLTTEIQMLSSPGRLSSAAISAGMAPSVQSVFIGGQESTRIAKVE